MTDPELRAALMQFAMDSRWSRERSCREGWGWAVPSAVMHLLQERQMIQVNRKDPTVEYELTEAGLNFIKEE